jgi:hypothetical protein
LYYAWQAMFFGSFGRAAEVLTKAEHEQGPEGETIRQWANDFLPIVELIRLLNSRRPKPTYAFGTLSPTVVENVNKNLKICLTNITVPEMKGEWRKVQRPIKGRPGKFEEVEVYFIEPVWPEGTKHCVSRFSYGSKAGNSQCEACGHAIKNPWNWVPLLGTTPTGPVSLWVGHDCAENFFGCKVLDGEAEFLRV